MSDASTATTPRARPGAGATRARILDAALCALRDEGIAGISARSIARHGSFNQALIFYHFGSVDGLLVAVARSESERRSALYAPALAAVSSLSELVVVARRLHDEELQQGTVAALTQMLAGAVGTPELAQGIADSLRPWTDLVGETVDRLLAGTPFAGLLPCRDLTSGIAALFLGIELLAGIDPALADGSLFATMESAATLVDELIGSSRPGGPAARGHGPRG
ncbi:MAG TPA: TetR/AcrR family transcriptional regulator [Acidimicrobiales bacterium]|nr:TetR/AcrR family transcriptional regulator [Acidimicrobiales bacterium]